MKKVIKKAEKYASKYWNKEEEEYRSESYGDLWCHYHNSFLEGWQQCQKSIDWNKIKENWKDNSNFDIKLINQMVNNIKEQINKQLNG